jgi:hypothetical protein
MVIEWPFNKAALMHGEYTCHPLFEVEAPFTVNHL